MSSKNGLRSPGSRPWSLALRLTSWYAGSSFALILGASGLLYWALSKNLDHEDNQFLTDKVRVLRALLGDLDQQVTALKHEVEREWAASQYEKVYVRILDGRGSPVIETPGMTGLLPTHVFPEAPGPDPEHPEVLAVQSSSGRPFWVLVSKAQFKPSGRGTWVIQAALDRGHEEALLREYRNRLWLILSASLVACTLAGYWIACYGIRPIHEMGKKARTIGSETLHERIDSSRFPSELSALAATFNEMLDRLEGSFERLSRFSADLAHELRTPINNLRGEIEVALGRARSAEEYSEVLGSCLEECDRLSRIIDSLLFLARAESPGIQVRRERVELLRELDAVREFYEATASEKQVSLAVSTDEGVSAELDRVLFQRAVCNLVENSIAHTPPGGRVTLLAKRDDGVLRVEVTDTGRGIPAEHLPHVFDRFYRVDGARSASSGGVGLGLALVKGIAALHGGSVELTSEVGTGTRVCIRFPSSGAFGPPG